MNFKTTYEHRRTRDQLRGGGGRIIFCPRIFLLVHPSPTAPAPPPPALGAYASEGVIMRFLVCILIIFLWCSGSCSRPVTRGSMVRIPLVVYALRQCFLSTFVSLDPGVVIWGAARYSEGSLIRRFVIPNTQISYTWRFVNLKMK